MVSELTFTISGVAYCSLVVVTALRYLVLVSGARFCSAAISRLSAPVLFSCFAAISRLAAPVLFSCSASGCQLVMVLALRFELLRVRRWLSSH